MDRTLFLAVMGGGLVAADAADLRITAWDQRERVSWTNAFPSGVVTVETAPSVAGPWRPGRNFYTSNTADSVVASWPGSNQFVRLAAVDISTNTPGHFTNLVNSYGILETIAGRGQSNADHVVFWRPEYEGGPATNANLSQPHITFADPANNLLIVDESSHSVLKVTPAGTIHTWAGTHTQGFNGDGPAPATNLNLNWPNGGWMRQDGTFYILDTYNNRVRRVDTNGIMTTLIVHSNGIEYAGGSGGRGLWVKSDESLAYYSASNATRLCQWTPTGGIVALTNVFKKLGNVLGDEATGALYVCDRDANRIYRMATNGLLTAIAGNGTATHSAGGGDGGAPLLTGLNAPRGIWFVPNGGYFITEHYPGNRVWYVDPANVIHLWLNGPSGSVNFPGSPGDGEWFYANLQTPKVYLPRAITLDREGNLILTTSNYGLILRIQFRRMVP